MNHIQQKEINDLKSKVREQKKSQNERIKLLKTIGHTEPKNKVKYGIVRIKHNWKVNYSMFRYLISSNTNPDLLNYFADLNPELTIVLNNAYEYPPLTPKMKLDIKKHLNKINNT